MPRKRTATLQSHRQIKDYLGATANSIGVASASRIFHCTRQVAWYWKQKHIIPQFHSKTWGGPKHCAFDEGTEFLIKKYIHFLYESDPQHTYKQIRNQVYITSGIWLNVVWICRLLKLWGYTGLVPQTRNINKYTTENILRWFEYYAWIQTVDPTQLRFFGRSSL
jgi:hypothetical protein